jgi:hypothetical protein
MDSGWYIPREIILERLTALDDALDKLQVVSDTDFDPARVLMRQAMEDILRSAVFHG